MKTRRIRLLLTVLVTVVLATACNHPIEIVGEGDVISSTGTRDCTLVDYNAGSTNCTENAIVGEYDETYTGVAAPGWHFHRWASYCTDATTNTCDFYAEADIVANAQGLEWPPLVAIFRPDVITGYDSLFIGHSFFRPFADGMPTHAANTGFTDHSQVTVFAGGANGAPEALWNNEAKRAQIQAALDTGDVDLFGMTAHTDYPTLTGYHLWFDYALEQNPDTRFFLGLPWLPYPATYASAAEYSAAWHTTHETAWHVGLIDALRADYPGVDIYGIPYGQAAVELYDLYDAGQLPDVETLTGASDEAIFTDALGHPGDILKELGRLVWLRAIYGVDLSSYDYDTGYTADLLAIADSIMDEHDPAYDAP